MIQLTKVSVAFDGRAPILNDATLSIPARSRIGILAEPGTGKTTLARVFAGLQSPTGGQVVIDGDVSWPLGFAGFFHPELSIHQNLSILARIKNLDAERFIAECLEFTELQISTRVKLRDLSPSERALLGYAATLTVPWSMLIADETITVGEPRMRQKCDGYLDRLLLGAGLVFLSRNPGQLKKYTDHHLILIGGKLCPCPDLDAGKEAFALVKTHQKEAFAHV